MLFELIANLFKKLYLLHLLIKEGNIFTWRHLPGYAIGNPKSACLHFYTAKTQAALALPFLPCSTLRVEQCFDSGCL